MINACTPLTIIIVICTCTCTCTYITTSPIRTRDHDFDISTKDLRQQSVLHSALKDRSTLRLHWVLQVERAIQTHDCSVGSSDLKVARGVINLPFD